MLKILQARLQRYMNWEIPDVQAGFRKGRGSSEQELTETDSTKFPTHQLRGGDGIQETLQREVGNRVCSQGLQLSLEVICKEALEPCGLWH